MRIKKRNGDYEKLCIEKIKKVISFACSDLKECSAEELELDSKIQFRDKMSTKEIQKILIQTAIEKVLQNNVDEFGNKKKEIKTQWQFVASRLLIYDLCKEAGINRNYNHFGYGDFFSLIKKLTKEKIYGNYLLDFYSQEEIEELGRYIVPKRDYLLNYDGLNLLQSRYLAKGYNKEILELPQERFMIIAMTLAIPEKKNKLHYAKKFYDLMSNLKMTVATPTLANAGKVNPQMSSCFISTVGDNLWSIYDVNQKFSQVSKFGGALGIYIGKVRALNSDIRNNKNVCSGVIPWIKLYNNTAVAVDQLGTRQGSASVTLDIWHKDIYDFLDIRTNNGDDRRKAHDIFPAVSIPNLFMERLERREKWSLFDPYEVHKEMGYYLEDYFDDIDNDEFTKRYLECENNHNLSRVETTCLDIMKKILKSAVETGTPFIFFRDTVNRTNPNKHKGIIYSSNLCHEIAQNTSESILLEEILDDDIVTTKVKAGDMVTCNLNSVNLGNVSKDELKECIPLQIRMLDNVITMNNLPVLDAKVTSDNYRAIGLGTSGYHQYLVNNKIAWESDEHLKEADELFEEIAYQSIKASMELAKEKGKYKYFEGSMWETGEYFKQRNYTSDRWVNLMNDIKKYGIRNGYIMAVAPTGSTSNIANTTAGIDPIFKKFFVEEKKGIYVPKTAPNLNKDNWWAYKEAHTIEQDWSIKACGIRQRHIDQAQSFNLYITPETNAQDIFNMYLNCWKNGIKTIYYIRNKSLEMDECTSCSS